MHCERLLALLLDAGMSGISGMGPVPLSWSELDAWQRRTAERLQPWEARALRQASVEYVAQLSEARDPVCPPPWSQAPTEDDRQRVANQLRAVLGGR